jgi:hypothetical protein
VRRLRCFCTWSRYWSTPSAMVIRGLSGHGTDGTLAAGISGTLGSQSGAPGLEFQGFCAGYDEEVIGARNRLTGRFPSRTTRGSRVLRGGGLRARRSGRGRGPVGRPVRPRAHRSLCIDFDWFDDVDSLRILLCSSHNLTPRS